MPPVLPRRFRRTFPVVLLLLAGCSSWRTQTVPLPEYLQAENPDVVRITRGDDSKIPFYDPEIVGDELRGLPTEKAVNGISIPLRDVRGVASKHFSLTRTILAGLAVAGGLFLWDQLQSLNSQPIQ